jgi:hypothetical protein
VASNAVWNRFVQTEGDARLGHGDERAAPSYNAAGGGQRHEPGASQVVMMQARQSKDTGGRSLPSSHEVPDFELTHGRVLWVLKELGFAAEVSGTTFNYYIKSLRKLGIPFKRNETGLGSGKLARYSYNHLMELSLALLLRVYGWLPDPVLEGLIQCRKDLYPIYGKAYTEGRIGMGSLIRVYGLNRMAFKMTGIYLDLQIHYSGGRLVTFGPPKALSPFEALQAFATADVSARTHLPVNLSALAIRVVDCAQNAPDIRRGQANKRSCSNPMHVTA